MKNGRCPRCQGSEVFRQPGHHLQADQITLKPGVVSKAVAPERYACADCGYVELYLADSEHREFVRENWHRVPT